MSIQILASWEGRPGSTKLISPMESGNMRWKSKVCRLFLQQNKITKKCTQARYRQCAEKGRSSLRLCITMQMAGLGMTNTRS